MTDDRWHRHFLDVALTCAAMSKDPRTRVGAVIVGPDREIRSTGFNGFARGIRDHYGRLQDRELKNRLMVHAETNAIYNAARAGISTKGCTLFLVATDDSGKTWGGAPCISCSMAAIQAGITSIMSPPFKDGESAWSDNVREAARMLDEAGVSYTAISYERMT